MSLSMWLRVLLWLLMTVALGVVAVVVAVDFAAIAAALVN